MPAECDRFVVTDAALLETLRTNPKLLSALGDTLNLLRDRMAWKDDATMMRMFRQESMALEKILMRHAEAHAVMGEK